MKFVLRNIAFSWILFNILRFFMEWRLALLWVIPVCLLLLTFYDDAEIRRIERKKTDPRRQAEGQSKLNI